MITRKNFYLQIADNALILSHRLSEYCSKAPFLEEDLANSNVALDLLGLAESVYVELARIEGVANPDDYPYRRSEQEFRHLNLCEQSHPDFAYLMARQFFMDAFHFYFFSELINSKDSFLNGLAVKSLKEVTYHLRRSSEWMIRLGDGSEEANQRLQTAVNELWRFTGELFVPSEADQAMHKAGQGLDLSVVKRNWDQKIKEILYFANIRLPEVQTWNFNGKEGVHTELLGHILCEMQYLPVRYPDAIW